MSQHIKPEAPRCVRAEVVAVAPIAVRVPQAVAMLGISRSKLYEFIQSGEIEIIKIGRTTILPVESLRRFLEKYRNIRGSDA